MASELLLVNPRKRRRAKKRRTYKRNPSRARVYSKRRRSYRRNPNGRGTAKFMTMVTPALQGAAGGVLNDLMFGFVPLPATLKTGPMRHIAKAAGAVLIGTIAANFTKGPIAKHMATGAMTVAFHGALREFTQNIPGLQFGDYQELAYYSPGEIMNESALQMGAYVDELGYGEGDVSEGAYSAAGWGMPMGEYVS